VQPTLSQRPRPTYNHHASDEETIGNVDSDDADYEYGDEPDVDCNAESILDKRVISGITSYLVKWKGSSAPSWEPVANLDCDDLVEAFEKAAKEAATRKETTTPKATNRKNVPDASGMERLFLGKLVAFSPATEPWLKTSLYAKAGSTFIIGRICDYSYAKKRGLYEIRWVDSLFQKQVEKVDIATVKQGRFNYEMVQARPTPRWRNLTRPDPTNRVEVGDNFEDLVEYEAFDGNQKISTSLAEVEKIESIRFEPGAIMRAPPGLYRHSDGATSTRVKPEYRSVFEHSPSSSFFAYLPISFWKQVLEHTNDQGVETGVIARNNCFTMDELMKFLGILWFMAVIDKGEYANYWGDQMEDAIFQTAKSNLDSVMALRRFKQLRTSFCFRKSSDISSDDLKRDSAVRIRSVLNMLKLTGSRYVDVGGT
jgi:hypothetical protein